ncbi:hypothetical protein MSAN_00580400 [Mycena sanguinolenta]|uniref:Uncharacterized protein n=1 Tax=Mycena sanguinolenta TaxID=230812 RepID=A0A8H6ZA03_9AGAR|nr:hypothetical protein MSAN_00580400 [Mycena sanguinolenta]
MVRCLLMLEWQVKLWGQHADTTHYCGQGVRLQGAMVFAARQATVCQKLATGFRRLWWPLTDRIKEKHTPASSESSGVDEQDGFDDGGLDDGKGSEDDRDGSLSEGEQDAGAVATTAERGEDEQENGGVEDDGDDVPGNSEAAGEDVVVRTEKIDELLAVQSASLEQYDEL